VCVANLFCAGLARKSLDQGGLALDEAVEYGEDVFEFVEAEDALGAAAKLAGGLRTAEQERAEDSGLASGKVEDFLEALLILGNAAVCVARGAGELLVFETVQCEADRIFIELHEGGSIVLLIACVDQGIEGEGIVLRSGAFFFDEGAEHAGFYGSQQNGHERYIVATVAWERGRAAARREKSSLSG
jgi:hypothetical protein